MPLIDGQDSSGDGRGYRATATRIARRIVSLHTCSKTLPESLEQTLNAFICPPPFSCNSMLAGIKHLNRLDQVTASQQWPSREPFEGLMLTAGQKFIEGTRSNHFCCFVQRITAPSLETAGVKGHFRAALRQRLDHSSAVPPQLHFEERRLSLAEQAEADEIFSTDSIMGIRLLGQINGLAWRDNGTQAITRQLRRRLQAQGVIS